jgi:hypothetical protein
MAHGYRLPHRATTYVDSVIPRCENLIASGIWSGLEVQQLRSWLNNFPEPLQRYFAVRVLDHLIYRSDRQTDALINQLFQRCLPELLSQFAGGNSISSNVIEALRQSNDPDIRLVPVIGKEDPPTKSGPTVARLIKRALSFSNDWIIFPEMLSQAKHKTAQVIVFVDDFLGTGFQFNKFLRRLKEQQALAGKLLVYAPLIAHMRGLERLGKRLPEVKIAYAEQMDSSHNLFATAESDGVNTQDAMFRFYEEFLRVKGLHLLPRRQMGYGRLGLCLAFDHATPNSSLPLLWLPHQGFNPLFKR